MVCVSGQFVHIHAISNQNLPTSVQENNLTADFANFNFYIKVLLRYHAIELKITWAFRNIAKGSFTIHILRYQFLEFLPPPLRNQP